MCIFGETDFFFFLLWLYDKQAYARIHQPKSLKEAELARKRLVFDEFFYLQVIIVLDLRGAK